MIPIDMMKGGGECGFFGGERKNGRNRQEMLFRGIYSPSLRVWIREFLTKRRKGNKKRKGNLKIPVQRPCDRYGMGALENNRSSRVERIQGSKKNKNKNKKGICM
ncbi:hypothetical protein TWF751_000791 [Orbilia oligospora]|nr:hypothetical protein TWF751_000791 [Orbilia oligospora]